MTQAGGRLAAARTDLDVDTSAEHLRERLDICIAERRSRLQSQLCDALVDVLEHALQRSHHHLDALGDRQPLEVRRERGGLRKENLSPLLVLLAHGSMTFSGFGIRGIIKEAGHRSVLLEMTQARVDRGGVAEIA